MFSRFFNTANKTDDYYRLGGPRSYHKFIYNNTPIILIGEVHQPIAMDLAHQYHHVLNEYAKSNKVVLFLESTGKTREESSNTIGFMDSLETLTPSSNLEMIFTEKRSEFCNKKYVCLWLFLEKIEEIEKSITERNKKVRRPFETITEFIQSKELDNLGLLYSKCCSFNELAEFLSAQIKLLDNMADNYINSNKELYYFIGDSILNINDALGLLIQIETEYRSLQLDEARLRDGNLVNNCIEMIKKTNSLKLISMLRDVCLQYLLSFHDATLVCDIWEKLQCNEDRNTFIVVMGDSHIEGLTSLFKVIAEEEISIFANNKGNVISPALLDEFLNHNFEHAPKEEKSCLLM
ncbi:hypothetical protein [Legionella cincinnatiensis]|uniref:Uncharacterized protein n=1 Tax=Legionella cincinnatiensis TaxID=28085 RepID=A0A378IL46_9GAMM|nr:hypothetical protein [Legionella cincinnatiensis]KTC89193.1 hypothetical protein Lcin_1231 [Legionella cincinnatiensis]STX35385.1 Uncharacterised protein [Legionella cincinnatiensis]